MAKTHPPIRRNSGNGWSSWYKLDVRLWNSVASSNARPRRSAIGFARPISLYAGVREDWAEHG